MHRYDADTRRFIVSSPDRPLSPSFNWGFPEWFAVAQVAGPALLYLPGYSAIPGPTSGRRICMQPARARLVFANAASDQESFRVDVTGHCGRLHGGRDPPSRDQHRHGGASDGRHAFRNRRAVILGTRYFWGDYRRLLRVLTILWVLNGASVIVGILQVRDPGTWMPAELGNFGINAKMRYKNVSISSRRRLDGDPSAGPGRRPGGGMRRRYVRGRHRARLPGTSCIERRRRSAW